MGFNSGFKGLNTCRRDNRSKSRQVTDILNNITIVRISSQERENLLLSMLMFEFYLINFFFGPHIHSMARPVAQLTLQCINKQISMQRNYETCKHKAEQGDSGVSAYLTVQ